MFSNLEKLPGQCNEILFSLHPNSSVVNIFTTLASSMSFCLYLYLYLCMCTCVYASIIYVIYLFFPLESMLQILLSLNTSVPISYSSIYIVYVCIYQNQKINIGIRILCNPQTPLKYQLFSQ